jgi:uncharacterized transporter YbjL
MDEERCFRRASPAILLALVGIHVGFGIFATVTGNDIAWLAGAAAVLVVALGLYRMYVIWVY